MRMDVVGQRIEDVETPALLLDLDAAERNIAKMAAFFANRECKLRPHTKTHKLPLLAKKQIEAGAIGITCAGLGEAEVFISAGIADVLIANQIVGEERIRRLVELAGRSNLIVCVDNIDNARQISRAALLAGTVVGVIVEVNVGLDRCGVRPGAPILDLARQVSSEPNLQFRGLMGYEGGLFICDEPEKTAKCRECNEKLTSVRNLLEQNGIPVEIVSAGGSNTYYLTGCYPGITEIQAGSYVTMDSHNRSFGLDFEQALTVLTTVISRPEADRAITDAGKKAVSCDEGLPTLVRPGLEIYALNEEHGRVRVTNKKDALKVGDKLEIVPSHGCTTIPLYENYVLVREGHVESVERIIARQAF